MIQWRSRRSGTRTYTYRPSQMETVSSVIVCTMRQCPLAAKGSEAKWTASGRSAFLSSSGHVGNLMPHELVYHLACEKKVPKKKPQIGMLAILPAPAKKNLGLLARRRKVVIPRFRVNHRSRSAAVWRLGALACFLTSAGKRIAPA